MWKVFLSSTEFHEGDFLTCNSICFEGRNPKGAIKINTLETAAAI